MPPIGFGDGRTVHSVRHGSTLREDASMKSAFLIGLDLGTSAIKGVGMDTRGKVLAVAERRTVLEHPAPGWVQSNAEEHCQRVFQVIRELAAAMPGPVAALAMSGASGNTLLADSHGGPLTPIINWMDQRTMQQPPQTLASLSEEAVHRIAGWPCVKHFPLAHLAWFKENLADLYASAAHYAMNTDWLLFRLTGNWVMDHSTATTFLLQDQVAGCWHQPFLELLDIPAHKLSRLVASGVVAGRIQPEATAATGLPTGTLVATGAFDHPSAARAVGVLSPGELMLSCGTSWVGFFPEPDRNAIIEAELLCDPFLSEKGGPWGAIFSVPYIGRTVDWYVDHVIAPGEQDRLRIFDESAAEAAPGAEGLRIDLREPPRPIEAKRCNVSRAVMEGAATLLNEKLESLRHCGIRFERAVMVGGPSRSPVWPGIVEDITGIRLTTGSVHAGAKGAAILAGIGAGIYAHEREAPSGR